MTHTIAGACHCGNLSFELSTEIAPGEIRARACDCSFCRRHGASNWSDPRGAALIRVEDETLLQRYRFGLRTADFLICRRCGIYLGALLSDDGGSWSTLNLRQSDLAPPEEAVSYGEEDARGRVGRRKKRWTPTRMVISGQ